MSDCVRCGRCCTSFGVCVTPFDIHRISRATCLQPEEFVQAIPEQEERERAEPTVLIKGRPSLLVLRWKAGHVCLFYDADGCAIYLHRPVLCRTYPFTLKRGALADMGSRGCAMNWRPGDEAGYRADLERYEKEVEAYRKIAAQWNCRGPGSLPDFLAFALDSVTSAACRN